MLRRTIGLLVLLVMVTSVFGGGIALSGVGTRAKAMGGAMRGLADDASAMYWNPAGISFLEETSATLGIHYVDFNGEYVDESDNEFENEDLLNLIPSVVMTKNCEGKPWNWGFGIYVPFGLSTEWDIYEQPESMWVDTDGDGQPDTQVPLTWAEEIEENEIYGSLMVLDFHPTFSYKFTEQFSAGLGLSLNYSTIELTTLKKHEMYGDYLPTYFQMEGSGMSIGANMGMLYKPMPKLSLGISGRLQSTLDYDGSADVDVHLNDIVAQGLGMGAANVQNANPDAEASIVLPADLGGGLGYKINENWLVSADFTYTWWEQVDVINIEFEDGATLMGAEMEDEAMVLNWENTIRFGLGTEYKMKPLALRCGYYYDESPLNEETMSVTFPDFSTKHAINLGFGYGITSNLCLDMGIEYIMFEEREVAEYEENLPGTYNAALMDIMLDLTWKF